MILGTWNLEVFPAPRSAKGIAMKQVLESHEADAWFLTELHADFCLDGLQMAFSPPRDNAPPHKRKAAIASRWPMEFIPGRDHPAEGRLCLGRLTNPASGETLLAASTVPPWRGATPYWRARLQRDGSYAEIYDYLLGYFVQRVTEELRPGEQLVWGGDFNQGLFGRDYVGTLNGRQSLMRAFASFDLCVPTKDLPALIEGHPAIDHIAIPSSWKLTSEPMRVCPERNGRPLSDHALYLAEAERT